MGKGIFLNIPSTGHINPSLPTIRELVNRGEDIVYVVTENLRATVEATGARFVPYPDISELNHLDMMASSGNIPRNAYMMVTIGERLLAFMFELIECEQPDYLIYDSLCGWGLMTARKFNLPTVAMISTFLISTKKPPPVSIGELFLTVGQLAGVIVPYWQTRQRIRKQFGVTSVGLLEAVLSTAQLNIVYTSRKFQPDSDQFGDHYKFVGPSIAPRQESETIPPEILAHQPLIYISLGTINNQNVEFFRMCLHGLKDYDAHFVMSIGRNNTIDDLGAIPDNFTVMPYVPQLELLEHTDVFITHGGLNSAHESLLADVPMIVVPQQIEQIINARQIEAFNAGIMTQSPTANTLITHLNTILNNLDTYHKAIEPLRQSLRDAGGTTRAVDEILAFVTSGESMSG